MAEKKPLTVEDYLDMQGYSYKDKVTGFSGTAIGASFDIAGCVQITLAPPLNNEIDAAIIIDAKRLEKSSKTRAMHRSTVNAGRYLDMLGFSHKDKVTGFVGIVTSINFSITGRTECIVAPGIKKTGELDLSVWFEAERLEKVGTARMMPKPDFVLVDGPEARPARQVARRI